VLLIHLLGQGTRGDLSLCTCDHHSVYHHCGLVSSEMFTMWKLYTCIYINDTIRSMYVYSFWTNSPYVYCT